MQGGRFHAKIRHFLKRDGEFGRKRRKLYICRILHFAENGAVHSPQSSPPSVHNNWWNGHISYTVRS